ncbi:MAG: HDOD domain-containing protein [Cellvibrionaceae bacterium]
MTSFHNPKPSSAQTTEMTTLEQAVEESSRLQEQPSSFISFSQERRLVGNEISAVFNDSFYADPYRPSVHSPWQQMLLEDAQMLLNNPRQQACFIPEAPSGLIEILLHESPAKTLSSLLSRDELLTKNVLKLANSRFFRQGNAPIENLRQALATQGVEALLALTASAMMHPILNCKSHLYPEFGTNLWGLSLLNAMLCRNLCNERSETHPTIAFLAGMLFHMGTIPIFSYVEQRLERREDKNHDNQWLFNELIRRYSRQMGGVIAHNWGLPDNLIIALSEQSFEPEDISSDLGRQLYKSYRATQVAWCIRSKSITKENAERALKLWNLPPKLITRILRSNNIQK